MSSLQVGRILYRLRKQRGLSAVALGRLVHMSQSKISRIETGFYRKLFPKDVELILRAVDASEIECSEVLRRMRIKDKRPMIVRRDASDVVQNQHYLRKYYRHAKQVRFYSEGFLPGLLQTPEYMHALFKLMHLDSKTCQAATKQRMLGQEFLWNRQCSFQFVLGHASLYGAPAGTAAQVMQLGRLEQLALLPNVELTIVPLEAGMQLQGFVSLNIIDTKTALAEVGEGFEITDEVAQVEEYIELFDQLSEHVVRGEEALRLIRRAEDYFDSKSDR